MTPPFRPAPLLGWDRILDGIVIATLTVHGVTVLATVGGPWWTWPVLATVLGLALLRRLAGPALPVPFALIGLTGYLLVLVLMLATGGTNSLFLLWLFVLVAIAPLVLPTREGLVAPLLIGAGYLALEPFTAGGPPDWVVLWRGLLLALIGVIVASLVRQQRRAIAELGDLVEVNRAASRRWQRLVEALPGVTLHAAPNGAVHYLSGQAGALLPGGARDRWEAWVHPDDRAVVASERAAAAAGRSYRVRYRTLPDDGRERWLEERGSPLVEGDGAARIQAFVTDVSDAVRDELRLRAQAQLLANVSDAVIATDAEFRVRSWNAAAERIYGWREPEVLGRALNEFLPTRYLEPRAETPQAVLFRDGVWRGLVTQPRRDGGEIEIDASVSLLRAEDGTPSGAVAVNRDLSAEREAERERARLADQLAAERFRLAALSRQLLRAQEDERRALAQELHDEIGQALTSAKVTLQALQRRDPDLAPHLGASVVEISSVLDRVRERALTLHPRILEDLGLVAALRWMTGRAAAGSELELRLELDPDAGAGLDDEVALVLYRVAQEALTNALRHARARRLELRLARDPDGIRLVVRDDGVGFDVDAARTPERMSLGLAGIEERVQLVNGRFAVTSSPGAGTAVEVRVPAGGG